MLHVLLTWEKKMAKGVAILKSKFCSFQSFLFFFGWFGWSLVVVVLFCFFNRQDNETFYKPLYREYITERLVVLATLITQVKFSCEPSQIWQGSTCNFATASTFKSQAVGVEGRGGGINVFHFVSFLFGFFSLLFFFLMLPFTLCFTLQVKNTSVGVGHGPVQDKAQRPAFILLNSTVKTSWLPPCRHPGAWHCGAAANLLALRDTRNQRALCGIIYLP